MKRKADDSSDSTNLDDGSKSHVNVEKVLSVIRDGVAEFDAAPTVASSNTRMTAEEKDARVRDIAVQNIRSMFLTSSAAGTRVKASQEILDVISSVVMSEEIASERLGMAVERGL